MSIRDKEKVDQMPWAKERIAEAQAALDATGNLEDPAVIEALLNAHCTLLAKRRSQSKAAIGGIVAEGLAVLEAEPAEMTDLADREALLKALCEITDGKMYCEGERAKLTRMLSALKEAAGAVGEAADILQGVNVETYGSLSKREKVDYILDQVRLMLAKGDRVRAYILSKKVQRKTLLEDDLQDLKVRFYKLMVEYHVLEDEPFELAQDFFAIFSTKCVLDDEAAWRDALSSTAIFLALSDHAPGVSDMMHRVLADAAAAPKLDALPTSPSRLANLLGLSEDEAERHVSHMVSSNGLYCKIDRPAGIAQFHKPKPPDEVLQDWAGDISKMLNLVEMTCHLINKESMLHKDVLGL
ncbi:hypothetical protein JL720_4666 [Aureococcus anophagefferens]|nr:hypothetical protein JL720_4666 [Aureococcus anophagefferens]